MSTAAISSNPGYAFNRGLTHTIAALYRHYKQFEKIEEIFSKVFITPLNPDLMAELPKEINEGLKKNIKSMHVFYNQPYCPIDQPVAPKGDQLRLRILENLQLVKLMCHEMSQDPKSEIKEHISEKLRDQWSQHNHFISGEWGNVIVVDNVVYLDGKPVYESNFIMPSLMTVGSTVQDPPEVREFHPPCYNLNNQIMSMGENSQNCMIYSKGSSQIILNDGCDDITVGLSEGDLVDIGDNCSNIMINKFHPDCKYFIGANCKNIYIDGVNIRK